MLHIITVITEICHCPNPDGIYLAVFFFPGHGYWFPAVES